MEISKNEDANKAIFSYSWVTSAEVEIFEYSKIAFLVESAPLDFFLMFFFSKVDIFVLPIFSWLRLTNSNTIVSAIVHAKASGNQLKKLFVKKFIGHVYIAHAIVGSREAGKGDELRKMEKLFQRNNEHVMKSMTTRNSNGNRKNTLYTKDNSYQLENSGNRNDNCR